MVMNIKIQTHLLIKLIKIITTTPQDNLIPGSLILSILATDLMMDHLILKIVLLIHLLPSTSSIANQYGRPFTVGNGLSSSNGSSGSHLLQGQNDYNLLLLPNLQHQQLQAAENDKSSSLLNSI